MGDFMREQRFALAARGRKGSVAEYKVAAEAEGSGADGVCRPDCLFVRVDAQETEVVSEARFEEGPQGIRQRPSRSQRMNFGFGAGLTARPSLPLSPAFRCGRFCCPPSSGIFSKASDLFMTSSAMRLASRSPKLSERPALRLAWMRMGQAWQAPPNGQERGAGSGQRESFVSCG
jgi:hypothetical protein